MHASRPKNRGSRLLQAVVTICCAVLLAGCHNLAWQRARSADSINAYEAFLKRYPESPHRTDARERLEQTSWAEARSDESVLRYERFLKAFPASEHAQEARMRLRQAEFQSVSRHRTSAKSKQDFIAKYPGTEEAVAVSKDLQTMAIVDLECPSTITASGSAGNPTWRFKIVFHERNGVPARINCTSIRGKNWKQTWWHPSPIRGNIRILAKGTRSYSSWLRGASLRGSSTSVSFNIEDDNGHSSSATVEFTLQ